MQIPHIARQLCRIIIHVFRRRRIAQQPAQPQMLSESAALDSDSALHRRLRRFAQPHVLVIDELGNLSCSNRHADLLFEVIIRLTGPQHDRDYQPALCRVARSVTQRRLRGVAGRPPDASGQSHRRRRRVVSPKGGEGAQRSLRAATRSNAQQRAGEEAAREGATR